MNKILFFIIFSAGIIHHACGKDIYMDGGSEYCKVCKTLPDMSLCHLCTNGIEMNHLSDNDYRSLIERSNNIQFKDISKNLKTTEQNHGQKTFEDARRTWLYAKIVIALILIITSAVLCHCRYLRMKRMGSLANNGERNVQFFPASNNPPHSLLQPPPQNMYLPTDAPTDQNPQSHHLYSLSGASYPPPPPGFISTPPEGSYPPPPHGFISTPPEGSYPPPGFSSPSKASYLPPGYIPSYSAYPQPLNPSPESPKSEPGHTLLPDNPYPLMKTPYTPPSTQQMLCSPPIYTPIPTQVPHPEVVQQNLSLSPNPDSNSHYSKAAPCSRHVDSETSSTNVDKQENASVSKSDSTGK